MDNLKFEYQPRNSKEPNLEEMREFVKNKSKFNLTTEQFDLVEETFRVKWNESGGEFVGDGDFNKYVYDTLRNKNKNFVLQEMVEDIVGLILIYMEEIGQYYNYHRPN